MASLALSIGSMSCLKRRAERIVPSFPVVSTNTETAVAGSTGCPKIWWIKQLPLVFAPARPAPIQITSSAVVTLLPANEPKTVLAKPVVQFTSALSPTAVLWKPAVVFSSAWKADGRIESAGGIAEKGKRSDTEISHGRVLWQSS